MSRQVRAVVLCEDRAHWHFARAFLVACGWNERQLTPRIAPTAKGAAEQWVRDRFPEELSTYRRKASERFCLIVIIDGDRQGVETRIKALEAVNQRQPADHVAIFVPCRNIETWIGYLSGLPVDETTAYHQLKIGHPRAKPAEVLADHCTHHMPLTDAPPSLIAACTEWELRLADLR
jgi:hypothetical protein